MGFPSSANDYVERELTINILCQIDANCLTIETNTGYAVINCSIKSKPKDLVLIDFCGRSHFARVLSRSLITDDGEALEGDALDDVNIAGVVAFIINRVSNSPADDLPVM